MKSEYINVIVGGLKAAGIVPGNEAKYVEQLNYMPESNLRNMSHVDFKKFKDLDEVREEWSRTGCLKFRPYIVQDDDDDSNPSLCLGFDRFLHMFRGYFFQISGTHTGERSYGRTSLRTETLMKLPLYTDYGVNLCKSKLLYMLLFAAMIDCGYQNENFRVAMDNNPDIIDNFFRRCTEAWWMKFNYDHNTIARALEYRSGNLKPENEDDVVYQIRKDGRPICRFRVGEEKIDIEFADVKDRDGHIAGSTIMSMDIPDVMDGIFGNDPFSKATGSMRGSGSEEIDDMTVSGLRYAVDNVFGGDAKPKHMLLLMLLKFIGIHLCWYNVSTFEYKQQIVEVNYEKYVEVSTIRDVR